MKNILDYIEKIVEKNSQKIAIVESTKKVTYENLLIKSKSIASAIININYRNKPIVVYCNKSIECIEMMLSIVYSGNFYVVVDTNTPIERLDNIVKTLSPVAVICLDIESLPSPLQNINNKFSYQDACQKDIDINNILRIRKQMIDTDPMYAIFTSGSTGIPKGCVVSHRNVISYIDWVLNTFDINQNTIFGSQTPLFFSMSVTDLFATLLSGSTYVIIPKMYFMFPNKLLDYLEDNKVNTIYWVPSALSIIFNHKCFEERVPKLNMVMFAGEVMPTKTLLYWMEYLPNAKYVNLFGPTETTDICTYYVVNRKFELTESIPIGKPCDNCSVLIVSENGQEAGLNEQGELYVRGSFVASGYYNNTAKTKEAFVQNPLNKSYPEIVYKTGDIVKYNEFGELEYIGRKDFQIKHMGYRIELGEIENAVQSINGINVACCVFDDNIDKIILVYQSKFLDENSLRQILMDKVPNYMSPEIIISVEKLPYNENGKIDRKYIKQNYNNM